MKNLFIRNPTASNVGVQILGTPTYLIRNDGPEGAIAVNGERATMCLAPPMTLKEASTNISDIIDLEGKFVVQVGDDIIPLIFNAEDLYCYFDEANTFGSGVAFIKEVTVCVMDLNLHPAFSPFVSDKNDTITYRINGVSHVYKKESSKTVFDEFLLAHPSEFFDYIDIIINQDEELILVNITENDVDIEFILFSADAQQNFIEAKGLLCGKQTNCLLNLTETIPDFTIVTPNENLQLGYLINSVPGLYTYSKEATSYTSVELLEDFIENSPSSFTDFCKITLNNDKTEFTLTNVTNIDVNITFVLGGEVVANGLLCAKVASCVIDLRKELIGHMFTTADQPVIKYSIDGIAYEFASSKGNEQMPFMNLLAEFIGAQPATFFNKVALSAEQDGETLILIFKSTGDYEVDLMFDVHPNAGDAGIFTVNGLLCPSIPLPERAVGRYPHASSGNGTYYRTIFKTKPGNASSYAVDVLNLSTGELKFETLDNEEALAWANATQLTFMNTNDGIVAAYTTDYSGGEGVTQIPKMARVVNGGLETINWSGNLQLSTVQISNDGSMVVFCGADNSAPDVGYLGTMKIQGSTTTGQTYTNLPTGEIIEDVWVSPNNDYLVAITRTAEGGNKRTKTRIYPINNGTLDLTPYVLSGDFVNGKLGGFGGSAVSSKPIYLRDNPNDFCVVLDEIGTVYYSINTSAKTATVNVSDWNAGYNVTNIDFTDEQLLFATTSYSMPYPYRFLKYDQTTKRLVDSGVSGILPEEFKNGYFGGADVWSVVVEPSDNTNIAKLVTQCQSTQAAIDGGYDNTVILDIKPTGVGAMTTIDGLTGEVTTVVKEDTLTGSFAAIDGDISGDNIVFTLESSENDSGYVITSPSGAITKGNVLVSGIVEEILPYELGVWEIKAKIGFLQTATMFYFNADQMTLPPKPTLNDIINVGEGRWTIAATLGSSETVGQLFTGDYGAIAFAKPDLNGNVLFTFNDLEGASYKIVSINTKGSRGTDNYFELV